VEGAWAVLRRPLGWGGVVLAGMLGTLMTFSYLGGFLDPVSHLAGLKVGLVNEDRPVDVAGNHVDAGAEVVHQLRTSGRREVTFVTFSSRAAALHAIHDDKIIGAIDVRPGFSAAIAQVGTSGGHGPPARFDTISNDGAGLFQAQVFAKVTTELDTEVNLAANRQLVSVLQAVGLKIDPSAAATIGRPVRIRTVDAVSVNGKTGRGLAPFYAAVMATLTGFLATSVASLMVDVMRGSEHLELLGKEMELLVLAERPLSTWLAKAVLALSGACVGGLALAFVAVEVLGMQSTGFWPMAGLAALGASAIALVTLIFLTIFGIGGELLGVLFTTIFGVPSALGVYPAEALPRFFRVTSFWHPMHYLTDGMRSLAFYNGRSASGLGTAVVVLAVWFAGSGVVGFLVAWLIGRRGGPIGGRIRHRTFRHVVFARPTHLVAHTDTE
jgi:YhgE/Pip-like protein